MNKKIKTITLCASVSFYEHAIAIANELEAAGFEVLLPDIANKMRADPTFSAENYKQAYQKRKDILEKNRLIVGHFAKVRKGEAILVINDQKHGIPGYIGGNVLMEMTVAYIFKKPIFVLNPISHKLSVKDEVLGLRPTILQGSLQDLLNANYILA